MDALESKVKEDDDENKDKAQSDLRAAKSDIQQEINQVETNLNRNIDKVGSDLRILDGDFDEKVDNLKDVL